MRQIKTDVGIITIRRYEERDIPFHLSYVFDSPSEFLSEIGFDVVNRGTKDEYSELIKTRISTTLNTPQPNALVAELDERTIALVPLDLRDYGDGLPRLHFHIFETNLRGKGLGGLILKACAQELGKLTSFKKFIIEPKATNLRMNALMRKLGFIYIKDYFLPARPGVQALTVSQYEITVSSLE